MKIPFMKYYTITFCAAILLLSCHGSNDKAAAADDAKKNSPTMVAASSTAASTPDSATMMKNWKEYMTPGKEHQLMASWNGTWSGDATMWMQPGAPPLKTTLTSVNKMALGGRYQLSDEKGQFMGTP